MATREPAIDADGVIDRMREVLEVQTDLALGKELGIGTSGVSTWRRRRKVPYADCVNMALEHHVSLDWLILGRGEREPQHRPTWPEAPLHDDPRVARMVAFIEAWPIGRDPDDVGWLERTLARTVHEYAEWLAAQTQPAAKGT